VITVCIDIHQFTLGMPWTWRLLRSELLSVDDPGSPIHTRYCPGIDVG